LPLIAIFIHALRENKKITIKAGDAYGSRVAAIIPSRSNDAKLYLSCNRQLLLERYGLEYAQDDPH
jgi:hypothetical protein